MFGPFFNIQITKKCTPLWAKFIPKSIIIKINGFGPFFCHLLKFLYNQTIPHYTTLHYTILHYTTSFYNKLRYTTLHYITLHYTPLHYIILHYTAPTTTTTTTTILLYTTYITFHQNPFYLYNFFANALHQLHYIIIIIPLDSNPNCG